MVFQRPSVTVAYKGATEIITNYATGGTAGTGAISYSIDNTSVATINNDGQITIKAVGTAIITATKAGNALYNDITSSYVLTVKIKKDQTGFSFVQDSITTVYEKNKKIDNAATGGESTGKIIYTIDKVSVATIDKDGKITIKGAGTAKITATKVADDDYRAITISYLLTVNKADQTGFSFTQGSLTTDYQENKKISNKAKGGKSKGVVSYDIDKTSVATIDANTGELSIKNVGTATITATKAADTNYNAITISYILTVEKGNQNGFKFVRDSVTTRYEAGKTIDNIAIGGQSAGAIRYNIDDKNVATIDRNTGKVTIKGTGTAKITAIKAADNRYHAISASYILKVNNKLDQTGFKFAQDSITLVYVAGTTISNVATGGESKGAVSYTISDETVATINPNTGEVTIKGIGTATITAMKAGDTDYNPTAKSYLLTVNNKISQSGFSFAQAAVTLSYVANGEITNIATGGESRGAISYSIDNTSVATGG